MSIILKEEALASIPSPAIGEATLFIDLGDNFLKKKLSDGSVETISSAVPLVSSVFGRTGSVVAQIGDYDASEISNFDSAADARITIQRGNPNGLASLDGSGLIPLAQIPDSAKTEVFVVSSQAQMLALSTANVGDIAIRTDESKTYVLRVTPPSVLSNWEWMRTPTDLVLSVAGKTGVVTLDKNDVGLSNVPNVDATLRSNQTGTQDVSTITGLAAIATSGAYADLSGTPSSLPPNGAASGELTGTYPAPSLSNAAVIAKLLTGFQVDWNIITAADSILTAINKLAGRASLSINTVSADTTVPSGYTWIRQSRSVFSGTTKITIQAGARVTFI